MAEFLAASVDDSVYYTLKGTITRVANTSYGNFDLTDETGTVYVYGLLTPEGASQKQWAAAGLREGDTITIKGKYSVYNNSPQIKNAIYVSHVAAPFIEATAVTVEAAKTGSNEAALNALLVHPLVGDWEKALNCFNEMKEAHKDYLPQFFNN